MGNLINTTNRFNPDIAFGLNLQQVNTRIAQGLTNKDDSIKTKTTAQIVKTNLFTLFNLLNFMIALAILYVAVYHDAMAYKNLMFMGVIICNSVIGIFQEIRAKKAVDNLSLISMSSIKAIRNGKKTSLKVDEVVLDDIICYTGGDQVVTDCIILDGKCEVNESFLTGEADLITKKKGDLLLSGSFLASGKCTTKAEKIGADNYASKILQKTKYIKKTKSEIMVLTNKIIKIIAIIIVPIGVLLFYKQLIISGNNHFKTIMSTSAALLGMIPEGLVLLISTILAVGTFRLAKQKVLVQDLYCIETLARVDTLCLDKTGTLTEGTFEVHDIVAQNGFTIERINESLKKLISSLNDENETFLAMQNRFNPQKSSLKANEVVPFSSEKKWSGAYFENDGSYIMGAAEFIFKKNLCNVHKKLDPDSENYRVLTIAYSKNKFKGQDLPDDLKLMAFVLIKDKIRPNAAQTLEFFNKQEVDIKIISGDNAQTVSKIAKNIGFKNYTLYINISEITNAEELKEVVKRYAIFGRATPTQKQEIIKILKTERRTVAMIGDGVNDVLALKESDCSIAIAKGSDAVRNTSHLILLNSDFGVLPKILDEGRRAINNIQRATSIFFVKTLYTAILSMLFLLIPAPYPFIPIQMTLISSLTIGIPSFVLALEANKEKIKQNLFQSILKTSLPTALTIIINIIFCVILYNLCNMTEMQYSTMAVIITGYIGILLIYKISIPFTKTREYLFYGILTGFILGITVFKSAFSIHPLTWLQMILTLCLIAISEKIYDFITKLFEKTLNRFILKLSKKQH